MQDVVRRSLHSRVATHILDFSGSDPNESAIYGLADPRDLELVRYIGQTRSPSARYRQHLNEARLWLPDELPWWVKSERLRPLYGWIRELHADEARTPIMLILAWTEGRLARQEEGRHIREYLRQGKPLLNSEARHFDRRSSHRISSSKSAAPE